jgi:extracellular factor (EF) 3-hydroxypalmitic acid methyl ester biosynthesis protein
MLAYDELRGSTGREIWYRPPRYEAQKLFPGTPPRLRAGSDLYQIHNICLGGVATTSRQTEDGFEVGQTLPVSIQQSGISIFESRAAVCRTEKNVFGSKTVFKFVDGFIDFDKLLNRNLQAQIVTRASLTYPESERLVPLEYRVLCADVLKLLRAYRSILTPDASHATEFAGRIDNNAAFEACEDRLMQHWRSLWRTANDVVRTVMNDRESREATKEFTELVLTPEMRMGALIDRSYAKPLGYPGDFEIMNQVYDWRRVGSTAYEMLVHRIGLEVSEFVKTRMEVVRRQIGETTKREIGRPARILSLGSGPAREVELFLASAAAQSGRAEFTLIDQEQLALRYAHEKTYSHALKSQGRYSVRALNISFTDILRGISAMNSLPQQDLIYSVGLFDYLTNRRATSLVRRLYEMLAPGGLLIVGNMNETSLSGLWPLEFITDWTLYYRDDPQMLAWMEGLAAARTWTETEPTGRVRLLYALKP